MAWLRLVVAGVLVAAAQGCGSPSGADLLGPAPSNTGGSSSGGGAQSGGSGGTGGTGGQQLPLDSGTGGLTGSGGSGGPGDAGTEAGPPDSGPAVCNDSVRQIGEECDDGNQDNSDGCTTNCVVDCSAFDDKAVKNPINNHCYLVSSRSDIWSVAVQRCEQTSWHLATIASLQENDFVFSLLPGSKWIGASDGKGRNDSASGPFSWVTGEPWTYDNWQSSEPNTLPVSCPGPDACYEHCALQTEGVGTWADWLCDKAFFYVCEREAPGL
jgi:hypothetical protein